MDKDTHTMVSALLVALGVSNSIEKFADCRDNVYGDIQNAVKRLGPEAIKMMAYWADTSEIIAWEDLEIDSRRFVGDR